MCKKCNKSYVPTQHITLQTFCSKKCQQAFWYENNAKSPLKLLICPVCKKEFKQKRIDQIYCSVDCRKRKEWNQKKRTKIKKQCPVCKTSFFDKLKRQKYCSEDCQKIGRKPYIRKKALYYRRNNLHLRIRHNISSRILIALKKGVTKSSGTIELLGCSILELKNHLQNKFVEGMSWENYGEWQIDHIRPCASFNLINEEDQRLCFHYTNLQPLWAEENNRKGAKWTSN